jgi:hypothetical protein
MFSHSPKDTMEIYKDIACRLLNVMDSAAMHFELSVVSGVRIYII